MHVEIVHAYLSSGSAGVVIRALLAALNVAIALHFVARHQRLLRALAAGAWALAAGFSLAHWSNAALACEVVGAVATLVGVMARHRWHETRGVDLARTFARTPMQAATGRAVPPKAARG